MQDSTQFGVSAILETVVQGWGTIPNNPGRPAITMLFCVVPTVGGTSLLAKQLQMLRKTSAMLQFISGNSGRNSKAGVRRNQSNLAT